MIKDFSTYINEDYFSKLANRKDNGNVRKENEITEDFVRSFVPSDMPYGSEIRSVTIRKENGETIVDIDGDFFFKEYTEIEEFPFQFGTVTDDFNCSWCENLTSLKGCPEKVGGRFECAHCENLTSLEYCPREVGGDFVCWDCGKMFTKNEIRTRCDVKGNIVV